MQVEKSSEPPTWFKVVVGIGMAVLAAVWLSSGEEEQQDEQPRLSPNQRSVMRQSWTDGAWPFTVDLGVIECVPIDAGPVLVFTDPDGNVWPLNGTARAHVPRVGGQPSLDPIWSSDPEIPGSRISIGPMIGAARALC